MRSALARYFAFGQLVDTDGDGLIDTCPEECLAEGYEDALMMTMTASATSRNCRHGKDGYR